MPQHLNKQDRQRMYNVTLRRVHETAAAAAKQSVVHVSVCVCVCARAHARVDTGAWAQVCACAGVALLIQHATCRHTANCSLCGSPIFFDIIS